MGSWGRGGAASARPARRYATLVLGEQVTVLEQLSIGIEVAREVIHAVVIQRGRRAALAHYRHASRADSTSTKAFVDGLFGEFVDDETTTVSLVTTFDDEDTMNAFAGDIAAIRRSCRRRAIEFDGPVELHEPVDREIPPELTTLSTSIDAEASVALRAAWKVAKSAPSVSPTETGKAEATEEPTPAPLPPVEPRTDDDVAAAPSGSTRRAANAADAAKLARLQAEKSAIRTELQSLVLSRDNAQSRAADLSTQVASMTAQLATARAEMRTAGSERKMAEQEADELRSRLQDVEHDYERKVQALRGGAAETRASAEGAISRLESELAVVRSELELVRTDSARDQRAILTDLEQSRLVAEKRGVEIAALTDELQSARQRLHRLTTQVDELSETAETSVATASALEADLAKRVVELEAANESIAELTEVRSGIDRLRTSKADLEEQVERLRSNAEVERQESAATLGDLQAQLREQSEELEAARALAKARGHELERVGKSTRDLAADLAAAEAAIEEHVERERQHAVTAENERRLTSDLGEATRRIDELERTSETDRARIREADVELEEFRTRVKQQTIEIDEAQIVASKQGTELESIRSTATQLTTELDAIKAERVSLADNLAESNTKHDLLAAQLKASKDVQLALSTEVDHLGRQLEERTAALAEVRAEVADERAKAESEAADARAEAIELQARHDKTVRDLEAAHEAAVADLGSELEEAELEVDRLRNDIRSKGDSLESVENDYAKKLGDLEHVVALAEARGLELDALRAELDSTQAELDQERSATTRQLAKARATADEWAAEAERIVTLAEAHASELSEREQQLTVAKAANDRLEAELESLQAGTAVRLRKMNEDHDQRQARAATLDAELASVRSELTVAKQMAESRANQNEELNQSVRDLERVQAEAEAAHKQRVSLLETEAAKLRTGTAAAESLEADLKRIRAERDTTVRQLQGEREELARREAAATARVRELEAAAVTLARDTERQVQSAYAAAAASGGSGPDTSDLESRYAAAHAELEGNFQQAHAELQARFNAAQAQYQQQLQVAHADLRAMRSEAAGLSGVEVERAQFEDEVRALQPPLMRPPPLRPPG